MINRQYHAAAPRDFYIMSSIEHDIAAIEFGQNCIVVYKNIESTWRNLGSGPYRLANSVNKTTSEVYANRLQRELREGFPELYADGEFRNSLRELYPNFGYSLKENFEGR